MRILERERGQTAVEFALCATVFFMIVFGLLKVAVIYGDYTALQHAARDGARKGSVTRGTGDASPSAVTRGRDERGQELECVAGSGPRKLKITSRASTATSRPNGTLWEAHDRVQVPGDVSVEARRHRPARSGRARCRARPRRSSSSDARRASARLRLQAQFRPALQAGWLRPVSGMSSARQSAVSTAACSAPASQSRSATRRASASISARTARRAFERSARGSATLAPSTRTRTGPSSACTSTVEPVAALSTDARREPGDRDAPGLADEPAHGPHGLDAARARARV